MKILNLVLHKIFGCFYSRPYFSTELDNTVRECKICGKTQTPHRTYTGFTFK